jgi:serine protease AprX
LVAAVLVTLLLAASPASAAVGKRDRCKKNCDTTTTTLVETAQDDADEAVPTAPAAYRSGTADAADRPGSLYNVVDQVGARSLWERGITGEGVDVAVIDTGVAPVPALTGSDKVGAMVDLSFEAEVPEATYLDTHGHGTHMAGIIAGSDPGGDPATASQRPDEFHGVAPDARIVSVKVGDNTGAVDVSQVIAGIDWVIEHRNEGDLDIRVLNLSYGTDGDQDYRLDPLAHAVERAWNAGIVVVAAAGNDGWQHPGLANPANDPFVISVGAAQALKNGWFWIPEWASGGELFTQDTEGQWKGFWDEGYAGRYPDLVAPGASIESLRVPGSRVAAEHPEGYVNDTILRGSGTSQAAAVVSGAVALMLEDRPRLKPDQVKALLMGSASELPFVLRTQQGAGLLDVSGAVEADKPRNRDVKQDWDRSTGTGSLEASRGSVHVAVNGEDVLGEVTVWGDAWDPEAWVEAGALGSSWTGGEWNGSSWTGSSWTGSSWTGSSWTGSSWTGSSWTGSSWTGSSWTGSSWTGSSWTGSSWTGSSWTGSSWTGDGWQGRTW